VAVSVPEFAGGDDGFQRCYRSSGLCRLTSVWGCCCASRPEAAPGCSHRVPMEGRSRHHGILCRRSAEIMRRVGGRSGMRLGRHLLGTPSGRSTTGSSQGRMRHG